MPVLPLIDLMIVVGWTSLMAGFILKSIYITTHYRPLFMGLSPIDFLLIAVVCLLFSLSLAARTWVKSHEPQILRRRRHDSRDGYAAHGDEGEWMRMPGEAQPAGNGPAFQGAGAERSDSGRGPDGRVPVAEA